jgi:exopolysaccharide biosynthesis protein
MQKSYHTSKEADRCLPSDDLYIVEKKRLTAGAVVRRIFLSIGTALALIIIAVLILLWSVVNGPSPAVRDKLVLSAMQASATKWVPGLFLDDAVVQQIVDDSQVFSSDVISADEYVTNDKTEEEIQDEWADAIDGMKYITVSGSTYKAYVLLIKDPSRVFVGVSSDNNFEDAAYGMRIFDIAKKYDAVAAINAGEFLDVGGQGTGAAPIGITYSQGNMVWNDSNTRTFIGFDSDNRLVVKEGMTQAEAESLGIRDGVCFQTGNVLIENDGDNVTFNYADSNTGTAQRTAIGQRADGTVIMIVTDGRSASSLGATHNDMIDMMVEYEAVSAGLLDGGSSSMMYYENYFDKYDTDTSQLDQYQQIGLVNKYKAFTAPRRIPTFFCVSK